MKNIFFFNIRKRKALRTVLSSKQRNFFLQTKKKKAQRTFHDVFPFVFAMLVKEFIFKLVAITITY